jgi:hypothetical protein
MDKSKLKIEENEIWIQDSYLLLESYLFKINKIQENPKV